VPQGVQVRVLFPAPEFDSCGWKIEVPRLRSGFRLRAPPFGKLRVTPAKRLKFESCSRRQIRAILLFWRRPANGVVLSACIDREWSIGFAAVPTPLAEALGIAQIMEI
jgi:hypothetical protein